MNVNIVCSLGAVWQMALSVLWGDTGANTVSGSSEIDFSRLEHLYCGDSRGPCQPQWFTPCHPPPTSPLSLTTNKTKKGEIFIFQLILNLSPDILLGPRRGLCWDDQVGREDGVPPGCFLNAVPSAWLEVGVDGAASREELNTVNRGGFLYVRAGPW